MKLSTAIATGMFALSGVAASAQSTTGPTGDAAGIVRAGSRPAAPGPSAYFTDKVMVQPVVTPEAPGRATVGQVTFQPGARSNWHRHPAGQTLFVTDGCGWTQREGGQIQRICTGDAAYVPKGVRHWHGATATTAMTHLAVSETLHGKNVVWQEAVTDAQYGQGPAPRQ